MIQRGRRLLRICNRSLHCYRRGRCGRLAHAEPVQQADRGWYPEKGKLDRKQNHLATTDRDASDLQDWFGDDVGLPIGEEIPGS